MRSDEAFQRRVATIALAALAPRPFALAGSSAIREHGITSRRTADIDLFTTDPDPDSFRESTDDLVAQLESDGFIVVQLRRAPLFTRLEVVGGAMSVEVDLGVDWRAHEPAVLAIGAVLDAEDAVANKVSALYSRAEARDFLDVDAIRRSGRFTDETLLADAAERDPGFEAWMFARQLREVRRLDVSRVEEYGVAESELDAIKERLSNWADELEAAQAV
jgi:hypothetical protein